MAKREKPIFSGNQDVDKTAFLNWRTEKGNGILNMLNLAEGYMLAGLQIAQQALEDNRDKEADITVFAFVGVIRRLYTCATMIVKILLNDWDYYISGLNLNHGIFRFFLQGFISRNSIYNWNN